MAAIRAGLNAEVAQIVETVLGSWSLDQASKELGSKLSRQAIGDLKSGKVGRLSTVQTFARGLWKRFCEQYGEVIRAELGECNGDTVTAWFTARCFGHPAVAAPSTVEERHGLELAAEQISRRAVEQVFQRLWSTPADITPAQIAAEGKRQLEFEFGRPVPVEFQEDAALATEEAARKWIADARRLMQEGKLPPL